MELIVAIPMAFGLGALHSLEPGHGKGVMTAYLISSRARLRDAIFLGCASAFSHTLSILFLAFVATSAFQLWLPEQIEAWLGLISGAIITGIGMRMVYLRLSPPVVSLGRIGVTSSNAYVCSHGHIHHDHRWDGHSHDHDHHHDDAHGGSVAAVVKQDRSVKRLLTIGVLTGLIPCPSALVMLLAAISAGQISLGIGLVIAFSIGGAFALSLLGILLLKAEHKVRVLERQRFGEIMATLSAGIIVLIGFLVTYQSIVSLGLLK